MIHIDREFFGSDLNSKADLLKPSALSALESLHQKTCPAPEMTGWLNWPESHGFQLSDEILNWKATFKTPYDLIVVIGIGGSYLGTRAVSDIMTHSFAPVMGSHATETGPAMIAFAGHNMSESSLSDLLDLLRTRKPLINVISKSGTTTEPGVAFRVILEFMKQHFPTDWKARIIATTDAKKGALRQLAISEGFRTFDVPDSVGGRYSVLTAVGLVPLALQGLDIRQMLEGAHEVFSELSSGTPKHHTKAILDYACCRTAAWQNGLKIEVMAYPEPKLRNLVEWWKQLFGESDGKNGMGLFPASIECTMDLHSMGQYMQEGARTMMETFLSVKSPRVTQYGSFKKPIFVPATGSNLDELSYLEGKSIDEINKIAMYATRVAHSHGGVPALEISLPDLSARTLGTFFALSETACAIGGLMLGVNPFNQPGVEAYKNKMFELLGKPKN